MVGICTERENPTRREESPSLRRLTLSHRIIAWVENKAAAGIRAGENR